MLPYTQSHHVPRSLYEGALWGGGVHYVNVPNPQYKLSPRGILAPFILFNPHVYHLWLLVSHPDF